MRIKGIHQVPTGGSLSEEFVEIHLSKKEILGLELLRPRQASRKVHLPYRI